MSQTVFVLGAGASADAGAPLMGNFLSVAESLREDSGKAREEFDLVLKARSRLQAVHSKAGLDIEGLESVFAAFEMAKLREELVGLSKDEVRRLVPALQTVIATTLEMTIRWHRQADGSVDHPAAYGEFADLIGDMVVNRQSVSVITFNYDLALDYSLARVLAGHATLNYCLDDTSRTDALDVMKLHGSLNWAACPECGAIAPWGVLDGLESRPWPKTLVDSVRQTYKPGPLFLRVIDRLGSQRCPKCSSSCLTEPFLVPPTWSKTQFYEKVAPVWQAAAQHLSEAENVVVIGYSLTPTDQSFRYLYALGTVGPSWLKRFWVVDHSSSPADYRTALDARYRSLLGAGVLPHYRIHWESFGWATGHLRGHLHVPRG